jgi:eukaryotic-like serine/threonine-protein kinase
MPLASGTRLGPYEIAATLGAGGMGEVYRAKDTRLGREVAIKVLPAHFSSEPVRRQRFEREAKAISGLNHPNICVLYDVGHQDGVDYLVMEYIDGETLGKRLERGPLPAEQVATIGREIAGALDRAHRAGIIHRDLKPGNIIVTKTGAKLLDFGLARPATDAASLATLTMAGPVESVTQQGMIVGTIRYMSPEQIEGKELDGRTDIFSLGAVLYEALTGGKAFPGKNQLSVASAILEKEPAPILTLKPMTPAALEHAIRRCLAKDREERWQTARDLAGELKWIGEGDSSNSLVLLQKDVRSSWRERIAWGLVAMLALATILMATGMRRHTTRPLQMLRVTLQPPPGGSFLPYNFAISPDGSRLAFVALGAEGRTALWLRELSSTNSLELTGTDGATYPFWSPDGQQIGFFAQGRVKAMEFTNSSVRNICEAIQGFGGTWNQDGIILFASGITGPMYRVSANGGTPEAVTKTGERRTESHHWPYFLPDGKHFLYFVNWSGPESAQKDGIYVGSLDGSTKLISADVTGNVQYAQGYLVYVRDRTVMAQPFDVASLQTTGPASALTQQEVDKFFDFWQSSFSISQDGKLVFASAADAPARLVWYDNTGKELGQFPEIGYGGPQFSPNGRFLAAHADDEHNGKHFIRLYDLQRGVSSRLTEGGNESNPVWSPDGKYVAYRDATSSIAVTPADGSAPPKVVMSGSNVIPCDWSLDGHLIFMSLGEAPYPSLDVFSVRDRTTSTVVKMGAEAQFSTDGKWLAYVGVPMRQVVVQRFPVPGAHIQISSMAGSSQPRWSRDGKRIYFTQPDRKIMVVSFDAIKESASPPELVAQTRVTTSAFGWFQYGVAPDGRLLVNSLPASNSSPLTLVLNWGQEIRNR